MPLMYGTLCGLVKMENLAIIFGTIDFIHTYLTFAWAEACWSSVVKNACLHCTHGVCLVGTPYAHITYDDPLKVKPLCLRCIIRAIVLFMNLMCPDNISS